MQFGYEKLHERCSTGQYTVSALTVWQLKKNKYTKEQVRLMATGGNRDIPSWLSIVDTNLEPKNKMKTERKLSATCHNIIEKIASGAQNRGSYTDVDGILIIIWKNVSVGQKCQAGLPVLNWILFYRPPREWKTKSVSAGFEQWTWRRAKYR